MSIARYKLIRKKTLTAYRTNAGQRVNGRWVEGIEYPFDFKGHYYPLTANEKLMLPDAFRSKSTYKLHSTTELYSVREGGAQSADRILILGSLYEVQEADHFSMGVRDHFEYLLVRVEQTAGATA